MLFRGMRSAVRSDSISRRVLKRGEAGEQVRDEEKKKKKGRVGKNIDCGATHRHLCLMAAMKGRTVESRAVRKKT